MTTAEDAAAIAQTERLREKYAHIPWPDLLDIVAGRAALEEHTEEDARGRMA